MSFNMKSLILFALTIFTFVEFSEAAGSEKCEKNFEIKFLINIMNFFKLATIQMNHSVVDVLIKSAVKLR